MSNIYVFIFLSFILMIFIWYKIWSEIKSKKSIYKKELVVNKSDSNNIRLKEKSNNIAKNLIYNSNKPETIKDILFRLNINDNIRFKELSSSNIHILKKLANKIDSFNVHTIGYSDLMYRYSMIIANELKLESEEVKNIALSGYLSNIGTIGLSQDLLGKSYFSLEDEMIKLRVQIGASIIENILDSDEIATIIRFSNERIYRNGYSNIPIGSKILAVVQTFLSKIQVCEYEDVLSFEKALKELKLLSNTQLDEKIVTILINWFNKKQIKKLNSNTSLGNCWEMRCSSEDICMGCLAYKNYENNCWENKTNNCYEHGNQCKTCFIYTEYLFRFKISNGRFTNANS